MGISKDADADGMPEGTPENDGAAVKEVGKDPMTELAKSNPDDEDAACLFFKANEENDANADGTA